MTTPITTYITPDELPIYGIQADAIRGVSLDRQLAAIQSACRRFDSYIRGRVVFPLVQVGEDVKECVAVLAVYTMISVRGFSGDGSADAELVDRYEKMIDWLKLIANGKAFPDVTGSGSGDQSGRPSAKPRVVSSSQEGWSTRGTNVRRGPYTND